MDAGPPDVVQDAGDAKSAAPLHDADARTTDAVLQPPRLAIDSIEGDGSERPIVDDQGLLDGLADRSYDATRRFRSQWIIHGGGLDTVTEIRLERDPPGDGTRFDGLNFDEGGTPMTRTLTLPTSLMAGLFTITLTSPQSSIQAQVFVLQGEKGDQGEKGEQGEQGPPGDSVLACSSGTCTLGQNLSVEGNVTALDGDFSGQGTFSQVTAASVIESVASDCPPGYQRNTSESVSSEIVLCQKTMAPDVVDEVVKVGDFWIDRYEGSLWENPDCTGVQYGASTVDPYGTQAWDGNWSKHGAYPMYVCSLVGVSPSFSGQWLGGIMGCALSGKAVCTNVQWQTAALGTVDPGEFPDSEAEGGCGFFAEGKPPEEGPCNTCAGGLRFTGFAGEVPGGSDSCISLWGAEDMIGNLSEAVADWYSVGDVHDWGEPSWPFENKGVWYHEGPANPGDADGGLKEYLAYDSTWNVPGYAFHIRLVPYEPLTRGLPAVGVRGGSYEDGASAGILAVSWAHGPTSVYAYNGGRCCINRR